MHEFPRLLPRGVRVHRPAALRTLLHVLDVTTVLAVVAVAPLLLLLAVIISGRFCCGWHAHTRQHHQIVKESKSFPSLLPLSFSFFFAHRHHLTPTLPP